MDPEQLIQQAKDLAERRGFLLEYIAAHPKTGVVNLCWRYNSHNPKQFDTAEGFLRMWNR